MIATALRNLRPGCQYSVSGDTVVWEKTEDGVWVATNIQWIDNSIEFPSKEELDAEIARLAAEIESKKYQTYRRKEYPPLQDLADALYWQAQGDESKMTAYLAAVEAVKQKYPKGV